MSIVELFNHEFKQRNKGHFSAIVRVALADGKVTREEKSFLNKLSRDLEISETEYAEILKDPLKYPINPPYLHVQRIERLYDLVRMVHVDHHLGDKQDILLRKIGMALGFIPEKVNDIVDKAYTLVDNKVDYDTFMYEMEHMSK